MAQVIGFSEDNVTFTEGPFVISNPLGNGWRIEVELKEHPCPVLPENSIYDFIQRHGFSVGKFREQSQAEVVCDWLNGQVREHNIRLNGRAWIAKD